MPSGADMCVQSTHKIISSLTQASLLLVKKSVDILRLKRILNLLITTSPSYILMASLDLARMQMATRGKELLDITIMLANEVRNKINAIAGFTCFGKEISGSSGVYDIDATKIHIKVMDLGLTGYQVAKLLNEGYKIQVEYADLEAILLIITIGNTNRDIQRLIKALENISKEYMLAKPKIIKSLDFPIDLPEVVMSPREALFAKTRKVNLQEAVGEVSAEIFSPYPPGIPLLNPGEKISKELIKYLSEIHNRGGRIQGQADSELKTIKVVTEKPRILGNFKIPLQAEVS